MKKLTFVLLLLAFFYAPAQKTTDEQLNTRLKEYLAYTKELDFNKAMEYMHPRLYTVAPKEQLIQTMEQAFNNPAMKISFDTMAVIAVSPAYKFEKSTYRKIDYFMGMSITLADSIDLKNPDMAAAMTKSFGTAFPAKKVTINAATNSIRVIGRELMFAIRDTGSPEWMFLGYERSNPQLLQLLYPRPVRQYFKLL